MFTTEVLNMSIAVPAPALTTPSDIPDSVFAALQSILELRRVRPKEHVYYHRWVDSWVKSGGSESAEGTRRFFDGLLNASRLCDWQFVQAARAVRLCACEVGKSAWAGTFDWVSLEKQAVALGSGAGKVSMGCPQVSRRVDPAALPPTKMGSSRKCVEGRQAGRPASETAGMAIPPFTNPLSTNPDARQATFTSRMCWRKDLSLFRGLTDVERAGFLLVLEWFENFRLRHELAAGREAATQFWNSEVKREGHPREPWQIRQWGEAIRWYLGWLEACSAAGGDHRSLVERLRAAVVSAGSRLGHSKSTKQCYGAWAGRYAKFAGDEREVMKVETAMI